MELLLLLLLLYHKLITCVDDGADCFFLFFSSFFPAVLEADLAAIRRPIMGSSTMAQNKTKENSNKSKVSLVEILKRQLWGFFMYERE